jgi:broad specificity phosphatase PhoE
MSRGLILVRHAMPEVVHGVSSKLWALGEHAREDCVLLAHALPADLAPVIHASDQPKVRETAAIIALRRGLSLATDRRFAEVDQGDRWIDDDYRAVAARYLDGFDEPGWEPRAAAVERFTRAVDDALTASPAGDLVVVNHGLALSLYLASVTTIELVPFWRALTFPDAWRLDLETKALVRVFMGGVAGE